MEEEKQLKPWSSDDASVKIRKYCDYQERSVKDVRTKLIEHKIYGAMNEAIISELIEEDILNEERYAFGYARGKFIYNQWGKKKIQMELSFEQVPNSIIEQALLQIDESDYENSIKKLLQKKYNELNRKESDRQKLRKKLYQYLLQKGYSYVEVHPMMNSLKI
jgi:regulatory protein